MMIPGFVTIIVIEVSYVWQKKNSFGPKCHGCVFFCSASRWQWWSWWCFGDGEQRHKMMMAISYHLYWLHVMFIFYASYLALIDGSIIRWSLTNYQEVFSLSMHRCYSSSCRDTTWWSGVISSTSIYNGCKPILHTQNTQVKLDEPSICRYGLGTLRPKGRAWII